VPPPSTTIKEKKKERVRDRNKTASRKKDIYEMHF
jgi:hypothetical protein